MMSEASSRKHEPILVGRYALYEEIAAGGMASVHYGRLLGAGGFSRTVAVKRLHPQYARDPEFSAQFIDEARLASRIQHPNVVQTLDAVSLDKELLLVMEYIPGETLARLARVGATDEGRVPVRMAVAIVAGALRGLHAAHDARDEDGQPLDIVHRDVSPQNIMVARDGVPRVLDFGVAKAAQRVQTTEGHQIKGKVRYMAPEQVLGNPVDRRTDVFAAGIVLWELLIGHKLFGENTDMVTVLQRVISMPIVKPSSENPRVTPELDAIVMRALDRDPEKRFPSAEAFASALESAVRVPAAHEIARWLESVSGDVLKRRADDVAGIAKHSSSAKFDFRPSYDNLAEPAAIAIQAEPEDEPVEWGTERVTGGGWLSIPDTVAAPEFSNVPPAASLPVQTPRPRRFGALLFGGALAAGALVAVVGVMWSTRVSPPAEGKWTLAAEPAIVPQPVSAPLPASAAPAASVQPSAPEAARSAVPAGGSSSPDSANSRGVEPATSGVASEPKPPRAGARAASATRPPARAKATSASPAVTDPLSRRK
jgi:serine/threonine-protein kinase